MSEWLPFLIPHFAQKAEASAFVDECESINRDYQPPERQTDSTPKVMMHQTVRLMSLADRMHTAEQSQSLSLFFMLVCTECVSKLFANYHLDGKSKEFVRRFFSDHVLAEDRLKLMTAFACYPHRPLSLLDVADLLYAVRCDVAHEGVYWGFTFPTELHRTTRVNVDPRDRTSERAVEVTMTLK